MRIRYFISVIAIASTMLAGSIESAVAAPVRAAEGGQEVPGCDEPPDSPDATPANRDRFVDAWLARFKNQAQLNAYTAKDEVPAGIEAEGFHDMDEPTQFWLTTCLLDEMLATAGENPNEEQLNKYLTGLNLIIFGKDALKEMREEFAKESPVTQQPVPQELTGGALEDMSDELLGEPSVTSADLPRSNAKAPRAKVSRDLDAAASPQLTRRMNAPAMEPETSKVQALQGPLPSPSALALPGNLLQIFPLPQLLAALNAILQLISAIQGVLFTLPVLNILASAFYKICAESPTMPLKCSISLPIGIPIPADVDGDNFPDVTGWLSPLIGGGAVGAKFQVQRLFPGQGKEPAHVFAVYDPPLVNKRIQVGFDGRADTLANRTTVTAKLHNVLNALTGDVRVTGDVATHAPGSSQALTFAVKDLVGGSAGVPAAEENPVTGAVQMTPVPAEFNMDARLIHTAARDQDIFKVGSSVPTKLDAVIDQATTTTTPKSNRRFTATVDKLPTSVTVDLVRNGETQTIDYQGSAPINLVRASDKATPNVAEPNSFTESIYEVKGVPTHVNVKMLGARDILYTANAKIPEVSFQTRTEKLGVLQQHISAKAHQIPKSVHVTNTTTEDQTAFTYDADTELQDVELAMYDLNEADETNLQAKATGIPTHMEFQQTKSTGVYDFSAPDGIDLIEATLSRNGGLFLPLPGEDHATVLKQGDALGLDLRLSGFASAHFDGHEETNVALGLNPGGQSFRAIADLDDPNVLATAYISALPANMEVTFDPDNGTADYTASSVIPLLQAHFEDRDTGMFGTAELNVLPKNIGLTFNTSGDVPEIEYDADSRLGSIDVTYSESPGGLGIHGLISDLPEYMKIGGIDPIVFDARTSAGAAPGSSFLGQIAFQYATNGVFASAPTGDDHVNLDTTPVGTTHAGLQYTGLKLLSVDTSDEELHAEVRNTNPRLFRAFLTTPTLSLDGFIDSVPATIKLDQVGNEIKYDSSSSVDRIYTNLERDNGDKLTVDIEGVPEDVTVLFDGAGSTLAWDASAATTSISAVAHLTPDTLGGTRTFDASLTITSIPATWDASWANGNVLWEAPASGIGSIEAQVTNHGVNHPLAGDHLSAFYRQASGDLDASLKISNLRKAAFTKLAGGDGGGFEAALKMGNHGTFGFAADVVLTAAVLKASGEFSNLPSDLTLRSDGGRITYNGDSSPDLIMSVEAGQTAAALTATPTPPSVHGVSLRDGIDSGNRAVKAKLFLTGLPNSLDLDSEAGIYKVAGYNPSIATLVVDVVLTTIADQPLSLLLTQVVPTASPVNFQFGPFLTDTTGDGTHTLSLNYTSNQDLGALTANATYGNTDEAQLTISEIPSSISVNAAFGADNKTVGITMNHGISDITAAYKKVGELNFAASVHLHDVPSAVNLQLGRDTESGDGKEITAPDFTFTASSPGLDIDATASAEIATPADITAAANLQITNLGQTVTGSLEGTTLHITSAPATQSFLLEAAGEINMDFNLDFEESGFTNDGQLDVHVDVKELHLGFQNTSDLRLDLGITTGLKGDFSNFSFGLDTDTEIHIYDNLDIFIDWPDPFGTSNIDVFFIDETIDFNNVISGFHIQSNTFGELFDIPVIVFLIGECGVDFNFRPGPGFTTPGSTLSLGPPPNDGTHPPAWLITPDLDLLGFSLPDFALDVIGWFASPYGNGFEVGFGCETYL